MNINQEYFSFKGSSFGAGDGTAVSSVSLIKRSIILSGLCCTGPALHRFAMIEILMLPSTHNNSPTRAAIDAVCFAMEQFELAAGIREDARTVPARPDSPARSQRSTFFGSSMPLQDPAHVERRRIAAAITDVATDPSFDEERLAWAFTTLMENTRHIGLNLSEFDDPDRIMLALLVLSERTGLETVAVNAADIGGTRILIEALIDVQKNNPRLRDFRLGLKNGDATDEDIRRLKMLTQLKVLDISDNHLTTHSGKTLGKLRNLNALDISDNHLGTWGIRELTSLTGLTTLHAARNHCETRGAKKLRFLPRLVELNLSGNRLDGNVCAPLTNLRNLTALDLSHNRLGDAGEDMCRHMPQLRNYAYTRFS